MVRQLVAIWSSLLPWAVCAHGPRKVGWVKPPTPAGVSARDYVYAVDGLSYTGYLAFPTTGNPSPQPATLLAHQWYGLGDMEKYRCEQVAATLGWPCFALDVYGTGVRPTNDDDAEGNMTALTADPDELHARIKGGLAAMLALGPTPGTAAAGAVRENDPLVDPHALSATGYCFGGQMVLELARGSGGAAAYTVAAVTSFHGELGSLTAAPNVQAVVAVHHAEFDFQGDSALRAFEAEMEAQPVAHWFTKYYGNMEHGWTDPTQTVYSWLEAEAAHGDMFGTYRLLFSNSSAPAK